MKEELHYTFKFPSPSNNSHPSFVPEFHGRESPGKQIPRSENVQDLEDRTVAEGTGASIQPHLPRTHPAKGVPTWDERRAFLPPHAHAAHRITAPNPRRFLIILSAIIATLRFRLLQEPHQRHPHRRPRRRGSRRLVDLPKMSLGC